MARRDSFSSGIAHPQLARAARTPNTKAPALWTHQHSGIVDLRRFARLESLQECFRKDFFYI